MKPPRAAALAAALIAATAGCTAAPPATSGPPEPTLPLPTIAEAPPTTAVPRTTAILNQARHWAFRVRSVNCLGTGSSFAVTTGIVTNRHVASGSTSLQMSTALHLTSCKRIRGSSDLISNITKGWSIILA